ncbi:MAG TPA: RNA methyltransferase [Acidimicrobiia bacterium]|nr:RNA methyltransferase [Acidimicrobiia bacterium]
MPGPADRAGDEPPLGARHPHVRELRAMLRDRRARDSARRFVLEGHRIVAAALDHDVELDECLVGPEATADALEVVDRCRSRGVRIRVLGPGVAARLGDTVTSQAVLALAPLRRHGVDALGGADLVVVGDRISDPGNAGTIVRSAAAAGAPTIALGAGSVDAYNPKVVRASAGALFGVTVVEGATTVEILESAASHGLRRLGAVARGGTPLDDVDLTGPTALVVGHEAHGLAPSLPLDGRVTIPMRETNESLNVAMAATVVLFEAARQRREASTR